MSEAATGAASNIDASAARPVASGRWGGLAPILSALCLVHCVGLGVLAPILPGALAVVTSALWVEPCLWVASAGISGATLMRARGPGGAFVGWLFAVGTGAVGFTWANDHLVQLSLGGIVALQVAMAARRWGKRRAACAACQVCDQDGR